MSYEVSIVADSISPAGARITTFQLKYPRMVHAELMTHRMFSRNASSTRAIPTAKMIEWIEKDPAMPVYWGKNQKGMQATEELDLQDINYAKATWLEARDKAVQYARHLMDQGIHKQIASRILEPWAHINVVLTATSFDNFFALRCDKNAMPEIQALAVRMAMAYRDSKPSSVDWGRWHLPYVGPEDLAELERLESYEDSVISNRRSQEAYDFTRRCLKLSVARCARVSYKTFDGKSPDADTDVKLHDQLESNGHWSPFEHQGRAHMDRLNRSGNFAGWTQYRDTLPKGVHTSFDFATLGQYGDRDFIV